VPQDTILPDAIARKLLRRTFDLYHGGRGMVVVQFEGMAMTAYDGYRLPKALRGSVVMISDPTQRRSGSVRRKTTEIKNPY
jgi:hypothetical protein